MDAHIGNTAYSRFSDSCQLGVTGSEQAVLQIIQKDVALGIIVLPADVEFSRQKIGKNMR